MPRMLDMIRNSEVPANLMQSAARGALSLPPGETIEVLVYLALHHKLFGPQARLTLAGWDEKASQAAASDPNTSAEVLGYFVSRENLRTSLLMDLAQNPSVSEESLDEIAVAGSRSVVEVLLASSRVMTSPRLMQALQSNPNLRPNEMIDIASRLGAPDPNQVAASDVDAPDEIVEVAVAKYLEENAAELATEKDKPFQPIGVGNDEGMPTRVGPSATGERDSTAMIPESHSAAPSDKSPAPAAHPKHAAAAPHEERRDSVLQKIAKLNIQGRIALAMRGNKEERSILIRDSTSWYLWQCWIRPRFRIRKWKNLRFRKMYSKLYFGEFR